MRRLFSFPVFLGVRRLYAPQIPPADNLTPIVPFNLIKKIDFLKIIFEKKKNKFLLYFFCLKIFPSPLYLTKPTATSFFEKGLLYACFGSKNIPQLLYKC